MIIIMKPGASEENIRNVAGQIEEKGLTVHLSHGTDLRPDRLRRGHRRSPCGMHCLFSPALSL